jgi:hypothetical protein
MYIAWIGEDPTLLLFSRLLLPENVSHDLEPICGWPKEAAEKLDK